MTATTEITIELDRVHTALRSGDRWAICKRLPDGTHDTLETWAGGRRSLFHHCNALGIVPSREAEERLALLPETTGFRDR
ncbi:MAG: hypothetical protein QG660_2054 [Pseudomonadota bacterium]|jgi:hypothetical protein|nr:hypothetical protein [Pseudomonadota bacterium]MDQ5945762.1 hypothetical protein [Pseudomonadota bacterium]